MPYPRYVLSALLILGAFSVPAAAQEVTTLTVSWWGNNDEIAIQNEAIKLFETKNPDIDVEASYTDGGTYPTKLQAYFTSRTAPDVMGIAGDILGEFAAAGVFEDLEPSMQQDKLLDGTWSNTFLDTFRQDDAIFAIPLRFKVYAVSYNKALFDQASLAYPKDGWTEQEFLETAQALTQGEGINKTWGFSLNGATANLSRGLLTPPLYDVSARKVNAEGNASFQHALEFLTNLSVEFDVAPADSSSALAQGGFTTGKFGMSLVAPWEMPAYQKLIGNRFAWDILPMPVNPEYGPWHSPFFSDGMTISSSSPHKEAAWRFIKFLATDSEAQALLAQGAVPALLSYATGEDYLSQYPDGAQPYNKEAFITMQERGASFQTTGDWASVNEEVARQIDALQLGRTSVDEAISRIQARGDQSVKP